MNAGQLKKFLADVPDHMDVVLRIDEADFEYQPLETAVVKSVRFCEDPDNPNRQPYCDEDCVVLDIE